MRLGGRWLCFLHNNNLGLSPILYKFLSELLIVGVWRDENHSPNMEASYYLRVISAPTCRWSHQLCMENDNYCEKDQGNIPKFVQERAWTSPIWIEKN